MNVDPEQLKQSYHAFFVKSESGQYFMQFLREQIGDFHEKAERYPESARDHVQTAKGVREAVNHITSVLAGGKQ